MNDLTIKYLAFIVAGSILIWGVLELNRRLYRWKRMRPKNTWVGLDTTSPDTVEDVPPDIEYGDQEETPEADIHIRAQQNGHHSERKKIT